jgi:hypothetical protein
VKGRRGMATIIKLIKDENGDAVVEATILFPIMIMIFAALVLLAVYLPTRASLQRATQYAATAIATEASDTWLFFDEETMTYYWETNKDRLANVYVALFTGSGNAKARGEEIATKIEERGLSSKAGVLEVVCDIYNRVVYKEVVVSAVREFTVPVDLSIIQFPGTIQVAATSTAVVQNGDEFIRNIDIAVEFLGYISEKFGLSDLSDAIGSVGSGAASLLGWR